MAEISAAYLNIQEKEIEEAKSLWTTQRDGAVQLRINGDDERTTQKPETLHSVIIRTVKAFPNNNALAFKPNGLPTESWKYITYSKYYNLMIKTGKSFLKLGLQPFDAVGIMGFNCPEWVLSGLGAVLAGGLMFGIYTTNTPDACKYVLIDSKAAFVVVENDVQLRKILEVRDQLPCLKAIVQYKGAVTANDQDIYSWEQFMELGRSISDDDMVSRISNLVPNKAFGIVYTSGTTGDPKGVLLSHDNITWTLRATLVYMGLKSNGTESLVSYLPLSHIAGFGLDIGVPLHCGGCVYFAQPDALKGTLINTLKEVNPTIFFGVPRVWEKMHEKMRAVGQSITGVKRRLATWAKDVGYRGSVARMHGHDTPWGWSVANLLVFNKVKAALGLQRCHLFLTGAAPITKETLDYFMSINVHIHELYGMSECSGPQTCNVNHACLIPSVGKDIPGLRTTIMEPDEDGSGEICMNGRNVFMGYLNTESKTTEAIDENGQLHSGDVGKFDDHRFLYITGRIKELLITAGGENIAPVPLEQNIMLALPCIGSCMAIGDKRKFLSVIMAFKCVVTSDGQPQDELDPAAVEWLRRHDLGPYRGVSEVVAAAAAGEPRLQAALDAGLKEANKAAVSRAAFVQKFRIIPRDFSLHHGELGPTLKMRRPIITKMYSELIDSMYAD